jgi:hypothetical protein
MTRERLVDAFLSPPLYRSPDGDSATLYTAVYEPATGRAEYVWPQRRIVERFDRFVSASHVQRYGPAAAASSGPEAPLAVHRVSGC